MKDSKVIKEHVITALANLDDLERFLKLQNDRSLQKAMTELEFAVLEIG